ncbi:hypothetical protein CIRG_03319 [Coccidioides immitis RMSCC 2394]|nr:hypothetical protein CIRG_03319 [Coccidioides immitis RMSCC 2394]
MFVIHKQLISHSEREYTFTTLFWSGERQIGGLGIAVFCLPVIAMAPLLFNDNVDVASMAGTWLGTLFAGIGFIALFSQLRAVAFSLMRSRKFLMERSAGDWAVLVPLKNMPRQGLVERVAPSFQGWLQRAYLTDMTISMTWDYRQGGGTSGWSNLFAHAGIKPQDLIAYGGPDAKIYPAVSGDLGPGDPPRLADMIFEEGKVSYGLTRNEFTALLIICGFPIADFSTSGLTYSTGLLGTMALADGEPFVQLARFDPHDGCRHITKDLARYVNELPIQRCIDYALGVLRTPKRGDHHHIIIASGILPADDDLAGGLRIWTSVPSAAQINMIKYTMEQFVSISGADFLKYSVETAADIDYERKTMEKVNPGFSLSKEKAHQIMLIAHALAALQPWGLLPVLPPYIVQAFRPLIAPFVGAGADNVAFLQDRMCEMKLQPLMGWDTIEQQATALSQIGDIKTDFFSCSNSPCRQYFKAMNMVFDAHMLQLADVRNLLAAKAALLLLDGEPVSENFVQNMTAHLSHSQSSGKVPDWAVHVYAAYLWGWLNDSIPMDFDYSSKFNRRIFLE